MKEQLHLFTFSLLGNVISSPYNLSSIISISLFHATEIPDYSSRFEMPSVLHLTSLDSHNEMFSFFTIILKHQIQSLIQSMFALFLIISSQRQCLCFFCYHVNLVNTGYINYSHLLYLNKTSTYGHITEIISCLHPRFRPLDRTALLGWSGQQALRPPLSMSMFHCL